MAKSSCCFFSQVYGVKSPEDEQQQNDQDYEGHNRKIARVELLLFEPVGRSNSSFSRSFFCFVKVFRTWLFFRRFARKERIKRECTRRKLFGLDAVFASESVSYVRVAYESPCRSFSLP